MPEYAHIMHLKELIDELQDVYNKHGDMTVLIKLGINDDSGHGIPHSVRIMCSNLVEITIV